MAELEALQSPVDPLALDQAFRSWTQEMGVQLQSSLRRLLELARSDWTLAWPAGQGGRALTALAIALASAARGWCRSTFFRRKRSMAAASSRASS